MRLVDLNPKWEQGQSEDKGYLTFNCPKCPHPETDPMHAECIIVALPVQKGNGSTPRWGWNGETDFEKMSLTPSIYHHCKSDAHFYITDGAIIIV